MPRARKPLEMQKGHLTVVKQTEKEQQEKSITIGQEQLARAPTWLVDDVAKKEFRRIVRELKCIGIVGNLDLNNIGGYCNSYAFYLKSTAELQGQPLIIEKETANGGTVTAENPLIKIQKNYAEEMRKFAALCGLTIDSRLKIAAVKTTKQEQDLEGVFGVI